MEFFFSINVVIEPIQGRYFLRSTVISCLLRSQTLLKEDIWFYERTDDSLIGGPVCDSYAYSMERMLAGFGIAVMREGIVVRMRLVNPDLQLAYSNV